MECAHCGAELPKDALFCQDCGSRVGEEAAGLDAAEDAAADADADVAEDAAIEDTGDEVPDEPNAELDADQLAEIPVVHYSNPGQTVAPALTPEQPKLGNSVIIGFAVIGIAVAVILIIVLGWVFLPSLFSLSS